MNLGALILLAHQIITFSHPRRQKDTDLLTDVQRFYMKTSAIAGTDWPQQMPVTLLLRSLVWINDDGLKGPLWNELLIITMCTDSISERAGMPHVSLYFMFMCLIPVSDNSLTHLRVPAWENKSSDNPHSQIIHQIRCGGMTGGRETIRKRGRPWESEAVELVEEKGCWGKRPLILSVSVGRDHAAPRAFCLFFFPTKNEQPVHERI